MGPQVIDPHTPVVDAARVAQAQGAQIVIDEHGQVVITPQVLPGQQRIAVVSKLREISVTSNAMTSYLANPFPAERIRDLAKDGLRDLGEAA